VRDLIKRGLRGADACGGKPALTRRMYMTGGEAGDRPGGRDGSGLGNVPCTVAQMTVELRGIKPMPPDKADLRRVKEFFEKRGLIVQDFSKRDKRCKTPDFRVFKNREFVFFCEVKSIAEDIWMLDLLKNAPAGVMVGAGRPNPRLNRISTKIHEAVLQLQSINPENKYPNILVFVNHDRNCRFLNLCETITGFFFTKEGEHHRIYPKYSDGRIKIEKVQLDLYIWLDDFKGENFLFTRRNDVHLKNLCGYFQIDLAQIKDIC
jgi:hypothetical protein